MNDTQRSHLPEGFVLQGYEIRGPAQDDGYALHYPALRSDDGDAVLVAEFLPRGLAQRAGSYVEPAFDLEDLYDDERARFEREVETLARIDHANVLATLELIRFEGTSYRVQAKPGGRSLRTVMDGEGPLSQRELYQILDPLLDGLEAIHEAATYHHAINLDAARLGRDGAVTWTGMSGARIACARAFMAATGEAMLAPDPYRGPELFGPETPASAADIYGLAALLYRLAVGKPPPPAQDRSQDDQMLPTAAHAGERCNAEFLGALDAGLALDPTERPADVASWRPMFRRERRKVL